MALIFACTILGAAAQILMKMGANHSVDHPGIAGLLNNYALLAGYTLYGLTTVLMVLAFQHGELGVLYPILSLSYVWVAVLSKFVFHEGLNAYKLIGIATIIVGVAILGRGAKR